MFTPNPNPRGDKDAQRLPSGSSLLFPGSVSGRSPMLATASPCTSVPFTLPTPGGGLGESYMGTSAAASAASRPAKTPGNPLSAFASPGLLHPASQSHPRPFGGAAAVTTSASLAGAASDMPPLHSLLDAGGPAAAKAPSAAAPASAASAPRDTAAGTLPPAAVPFPSAAASGSGYWVTAFGYTSNAMLGAVLEELRPSGGEIVQHVQGSGPWLHVRYAEWRQLQQAVSKNGKVVQGAMLGVLEGIHPKDSGFEERQGCMGGVSSAGAAAIGATWLPGAGIPLRLQQGHSHSVGPSLRAPPLARGAARPAGWWTRLCEFVFGW